MTEQNEHLNFKRYVLIHAAFLEENGNPNYIYRAHLNRSIDLWKQDSSIVLILVAGLHYQERRQDIAGTEYLIQRGVPRDSIINLDNLQHPLNEGAHNSTDEIKIFRKIIKNTTLEGVSVRPEVVTNTLHWGRIVVAYRKLLPNAVWHRTPLEFKISNLLKEGLGYTLAYAFGDPLQEGIIFQCNIKQRGGTPNFKLGIPEYMLIGWLAVFVISAAMWVS